MIHKDFITLLGQREEEISERYMFFEIMQYYKDIKKVCVSPFIYSNKNLPCQDGLTFSPDVTRMKHLSVPRLAASWRDNGCPSC